MARTLHSQCRGPRVRSLVRELDSPHAATKTQGSQDNEGRVCFTHFCILRTLIRVDTLYLLNEHMMDSLGEPWLLGGTVPSKNQRGLTCPGRVGAQGSGLLDQWSPRW